MNNAVMLWAALNGLVGFLLFYAGYRLHGSKQGVRPDAWGAGTRLSELMRTCSLAAALCLAYYALLFTLYYFLHVDLPVPVHGGAALPAADDRAPWHVSAVFLPLLPFQLAQVNGAMRFEGQAEWTGMLVGGLANSAGLLLIVVVQYATLAATGTVYWTEGWLYVNLLFAVVPMMFVLPYFNRYFFRMTGRNLSGRPHTCLVFVMILLSNTVCYLPL